MSFESIIRDFVIKLTAYRDELSLKKTGQNNPVIRYEIFDRSVAISSLISKCNMEIDNQIKFEKLMKEMGLEINFPD